MTYIPSIISAFSSAVIFLRLVAEIFEPGLNKLFPELDNEKDFPAQTISMHHSPDGSMYWLGGQLGEIKKVRRIPFLYDYNIL